MVPWLKEGSRVRVVRAPHPLLVDLAGRTGEVKRVWQRENRSIFKVDVPPHGPVWFAEHQLEALPEGEEKVPEAEGGPQDPREVGP